jgi:hypothetical protein
MRELPPRPRRGGEGRGEGELVVVLTRCARTAFGGYCNLDEAAAVFILGVPTVVWREAGWLGWIGARAEGGSQGRRARVLACRGCRDPGGKRAQREEPKR